MSRSKARKAGRRGIGSPVLKGLLAAGVLLTTFVSGVLVGQLHPRPLDRFLRFDAETEPPSAERIAAPIPDQIFTFYDELLPAGEPAAPAPRPSSPSPAEEAPPEAPADSEARRLERAPSPPQEEATAPRALSREGRPAATDDVAAAEVPPSPPPAEAPAAPSRSLQRSGAAEPTPSGAEQEALTETAAVRDVAEEPAPSEARSAAVARGEGDAEEQGGERRILRRGASTAAAPEPSADPVATPLDREIGSTQDWGRAQMVRAQLREEGVSVAVISVEEPGEGRRVALVLQGEHEASLAELRRRVAELMGTP